MKKIFILFILLFAAPAIADLYKCVDENGVVTFNDHGCDETAIKQETMQESQKSDAEDSKQSKTSSSDNGGFIDFCKNKWPQDYSMQKYCIEKNSKAVQEVVRLANHYGKGSEEYNIIGRCGKNWYPQFDMVLHCAKKQINAYHALQ